jgi:hypothetical protein
MEGGSRRYPQRQVESSQLGELQGTANDCVDDSRSRGAGLSVTIA